MSQILNVFLLSLTAGLATGLGGLIAIFSKPGKRSFGFLMGITAGVMISLSFMELVNKAWEMGGFLTATIGFTAGALFMFAIDTLIPHMRFGETEAGAYKQNVSTNDDFQVQTKAKHAQKRRCWFLRSDGIENTAMQKETSPFSKLRPRHMHHRRRGRRGFYRTSGPINRTLIKAGLLIAIGITIHNMPEGIAVGAGYAHQPQFGYFIALAIALHNIPEGIATALPLSKGGICRWDAFRIALLSGLTEPIGALAAILFLTTFQNFVPAALAFAGGVMTFITLDELIPTAREHGHQHYTAIGIILGTIFVFILSGIFGM